MKKSRVLLLLAVVALILLSGTTAFAVPYSGHFWNGYDTDEDTSVSANGYIQMNNQEAQFMVNNIWFDGAEFKTTARCTGSGSFDQASFRTGKNTSHYFDWTGTAGTGWLRFDNDYSPYSSWYLWNKGTFY